MKYTVDLNGRDGVAFERGQKNAAKAVSYCCAEASFEGFKNEFAARLVRGTDLPCGITPVHPIPLPWLVYHVDFSGCGLAGSSS